ncbi:MAG: enoyl-CoA hydratase/isomerase family protein [Thermoplasmata archaeon]
MKVIALPLIAVERKEKFAIVAINRPEKKNALSIDVLMEIKDALKSLSGMNALIFKGSGGFFSAGGDLAVMYSADREQGREFSRTGNQVMDLIEGYEGVTIAAIEGGAYGGGLELALSCDIRIAAEKTKLGLTEVNLGLFPGWGGIKRIRKIAGPAAARYVALTGTVMTGSEAFRMGLVSMLCDDPLRCAEQLAESISTKSRDSIRSIKHLVSNEPYNSEEEYQMFGDILWSDAAREALAKFLKLK